MPEKSSPKKSKPESLPADWQWYLQALDQKLEAVREQTQGILERFHRFEMQQQSLEGDLQQQLHSYRMNLQELDQSLQYLSHKTQLQLKDHEQSNERFRHETERKVADIHFATREELNAISRRLEMVEKLLF